MRMILFRELEVTALVIIVTLAMVVIIFSLRVLGIYYVHSKKLSKLRTKRDLPESPTLSFSVSR